MVDVSSVTSSTTSSSTTSSASSSFLGDYDLFLSLLTTQITNQDPLDPMDTSEYTNQLVQYTAVEQSLQTNEYLAELLDAISAQQASNYVSYLGSYVTAEGDTTMLSDGSASWSYEVSEAASGTVSIYNSAGSLIYEGDVELSAGNGTYTWDGTTSTGATAAEGAYTISFDVEDSRGNSETVTTTVTGLVDKVDMSSDTTYLQVGDVKIPVSAVTSVSRSG